MARSSAWPPRQSGSSQPVVASTAKAIPTAAATIWMKWRGTKWKMTGS